jgi:hypothetical protein
MGAIGIDELEKLMNKGDYIDLKPDGSVTIAPRGGLKDELERVRSEWEQCAAKLAALKELLDTPEIELFDKAVPLEAAHQIKRWGAEHDAGKEPEDWFWLVGYLAGKALAAFRAHDQDKAKHHCISAAAALRNWHQCIRTGANNMRPGISAEKQSIGG